MKDQFTEGKTQEDWIREIYEAGAEEDAEMPSWDEIMAQGLYKRDLADRHRHEGLPRRPRGQSAGNALGQDRDLLRALGRDRLHVGARRGRRHQPHSRVHPGLPGLRHASPTNIRCTAPASITRAAPTRRSASFPNSRPSRASSCGSTRPTPKAAASFRAICCSVKSPAGEIRIEAKVTPRIVPGTVGIPQGAWHKADMFGDKVDEGACVNTLTTYRPTPLGKGNGNAHT